MGKTLMAIGISILSSIILSILFLGGIDVIVHYFGEEEQVDTSNLNTEPENSAYLANITEIETKVFAYINEERTNHDLPALQEDSNLITIASQWSQHLAGTGYLTHGDFESRIASIGYSYYLCGEIIAMYGGWHSDLAHQFVDMWIGSEGHYKIMMTPERGYMGVGVCEGEGIYYAVVDFRFLD